ncbi:MAG TPA: SDR family NAD(P)-dependent oxidoreductase [Acidimicrobiales bacterium]|nr:SDR family NAD(P)-dependent oxidoreductase [Acidimicrobiales bacterium]
MDLGLEAKRALVTGGSRGIGKAVARQLALEGADVAIAARDQGRLDAAAKELAELTGRRIVPFTVDTSSNDSVTQMVAAAAEALGGIDILVNAAARPGGQAPPPKYDELTEEEFFDHMNVKVMGYLRVVQQVAPHMKSNGWGRIVNISGMAARQTGTIIGSMRNVAVVAMTKNLADALGPFGINVTVVHPGTTRTEATAPDDGTPFTGNIIGHMVDATEVADVVCFLASPRGVAISGDLIAAGGGSPRAIYY